MCGDVSAGWTMRYVLFPWLADSQSTRDRHFTHRCIELSYAPLGRAGKVIVARRSALTRRCERYVELRLRIRPACQRRR